jgi:hypothetical protein
MKETAYTAASHQSNTLGATPVSSQDRTGQSHHHTPRPFAIANPSILPSSLFTPAQQTQFNPKLHFSVHNPVPIPILSPGRPFLLLFDPFKKEEPSNGLAIPAEQLHALSSAQIVFFFLLWLPGFLQLFETFEKGYFERLDTQRLYS